MTGSPRARPTPRSAWQVPSPRALLMILKLLCKNTRTDANGTWQRKKVQISRGRGRAGFAGDVGEKGHSHEDPPSGAAVGPGDTRRPPWAQHRCRETQDTPEASCGGGRGKEKPQTKGQHVSQNQPDTAPETLQCRQQGGQRDWITAPGK